MASLCNMQNRGMGEGQGAVGRGVGREGGGSKIYRTPFDPCHWKPVLYIEKLRIQNQAIASRLVRAGIAFLIEKE